MTEINESTSSAIALLVDEWGKAEHAIKQAELISQFAIIPAINELRFAGRRAVEALGAVNKGESAEHIAGLLHDACIECQRARYDALDVAIAAMFADLELAERELGIARVFQAFPEYLDLRHKLEGLGDKLARARQNHEYREALYDELNREIFPQTLTLYRAFKTSQHLLQQMVRQTRVKAAVAYVTGVAGLFIGILGLILYFRSMP